MHLASNTHLPGMAHPTQPVPASQGSEKHVRGPFAPSFLILHQNTESLPSRSSSFTSLPHPNAPQCRHGGFSLETFLPGWALTLELQSSAHEQPIPDFPWGLWSPCWSRRAQSDACVWPLWSMLEAKQVVEREEARGKGWIPARQGPTQFVTVRLPSGHVGR